MDAMEIVCFWIPMIFLVVCMICGVIALINEFKTEKSISTIIFWVFSLIPLIYWSVCVYQAKDQRLDEQVKWSQAKIDEVNFNNKFADYIKTDKSVNTMLNTLYKDNIDCSNQNSIKIKFDCSQLNNKIAADLNIESNSYFNSYYFTIKEANKNLPEKAQSIWIQNNTKNK